MNVQNPRDPQFEALKDITRLAWLMNFEALATVPGSGTALLDECQ
jgi:hypothetical protein